MRDDAVREPRRQRFAPRASAPQAAGWCLLLLFGAACGGKVGHDDPGAASGGANPDGPEACVNALPWPTVDFEPTCASFAPVLGSVEVTFVEGSVVEAGVPVFAHRFRALYSFGFDLVLAFPGVSFTPDPAPFTMNTWWITGSEGTGILAVVLRHSYDAPVALAVATSANVDQLNDLLSPLAVEFSDSGCPAPIEAGLVKPWLTRNGEPLSCEDKASAPGVRLCRDGDTRYHLLNYMGLPGTSDHPVVFGGTDWLGEGAW